MEAEHGSNVFCLAISQDNQRIFSGGNDLQTIIHDTKLQVLNSAKQQRKL
jgi:WD40 repeat protein